MRPLHQVPGPQAQPAPRDARSTHTSGQSFEQLRRACLRKGVLFEDADFPADSSSLFYSERPPVPFEWRRPGVSAWRGPGGRAPHTALGTPAHAAVQGVVCWHMPAGGCSGGPQGVGLHPPSALSPSEARLVGAGLSCIQDNSRETRPTGSRASV